MDADMRRIAFFAVCALALSCEGTHERAVPTPPAVPPEIAVSRHPSSLGTEFVIEKDGCRIEWTVLTTELGVVRHRSKCALTPAGQAPLLEKVLNSVLAAGIGIRTLDWGRLFPDGAEDATMAVRLASAARNSANWDTVRGKSRGPDMNGAVRDLANQAEIYEELRLVFRQAGLELTLASVEKVLVTPASNLVFFERLKDQGVGTKDRVPFDFQAWFAISPTKPDSKGSR
jgi:hypothetical protein